MADLTDVAQALVDVINGALYPNGTSEASAINAACRVGRGWPLKGALDADLKAKVLNVSVIPVPGMERNTTRYSTDWQTLAQPVHSITATVTPTTVTLAGTVSVPQNVAVLVNGTAYIHAVQTGETLTSIATALAAQINVDTTASSAGAVITIAGAHALEARIGGVGIIARVLRSQQRLFQISVWASSPEQRTAAAVIIDGAFAHLSFLTLSDGFAARITYQKTAENDRNMLDGLYRRDLDFLVDYATTETSTATEIVVFTPQIEASQ
jgi:hypothetical protein